MLQSARHTIPGQVSPQQHSLNQFLYATVLHTHSHIYKKLDTPARGQITTIGHFKLWKKQKKAKERCMEIPVIVLDQKGEWAFWSKLAGWLSSSWHLAWLKQPILQKVTELENLSSVSQILPAHVVTFLPFSPLLYLSAFLLSCSYSFLLGHGLAITTFACWRK